MSSSLSLTLGFLEEYRLMQAGPAVSKLIGMKVAVSLLLAYQRKFEPEGVIYRGQIKKRMREWVEG